MLDDFLGEDQQFLPTRGMLDQSCWSLWPSIARLTCREMRQSKLSLEEMEWETLIGTIGQDKASDRKKEEERNSQAFRYLKP